MDSPTLNGNGAPVFRSPNATIHPSPLRPPAESDAASLKGGNRSGTAASRADSCCASFAIQKKGEASHVAGAWSVACAHPASLHRVFANGGTRSSAPCVRSRRGWMARRRAATSAWVAAAPPSVRVHHARTSSIAARVPGEPSESMPALSLIHI